jgi:hypothetical protein
MAKRIYWIILILSFVAGAALYFGKDSFSPNTLLALFFLSSMIMIISVHGIIAHSISLKVKGGLIVYPILMGVLFAVLFFICIFFILPLFCPNFLSF